MTENVNDISVAGKYAYIVKDTDASTGTEFKIIDISNPSSPVALGGVDFATGNSVYAAGKYAYFGRGGTSSGTCSGATVTGCEFVIYDIQNPSSPTAVSGFNVASVVNDIVVVGKYAFITTNANGSASEFRILDISNPSAISEVGPGIEIGFDANQVFVSGKYAYVVNDSDASTGNEFRIIDISNPLSPSAVGGINMTASTNTVYVSGRYAYLGTGSVGGTCSGATTDGCEFRIYDVSNPASPSSVSGTNEAIAVDDLTIAGNYAYFGRNSTCD